MMRNKETLIFLVPLLTVIIYNCAFITHSPQRQGILSPSDQLIWQKITAEWDSEQTRRHIDITYPYDGAVFPPEIAAPAFLWTDQNDASAQWLVIIRFSNAQPPIYAATNTPQWMPDKETWEIIKAGSAEAPAEIAVFGIRTEPVKSLISEGRIRISTSKDRVDASILYRQVPLPFTTGPKTFRKMKWRLGDIASYSKPPVIMENLPTCAGCHSFSKDSRLISMELNYRGDSGAHFITPVQETIKLSARHFMSWKNFPKPEILPRTRGVFAKLSPSGNYLIGTVNEISFSALTNDPAYCQLFFPTYGVMAWYDVKNRQFHRLNGADDIEFVQTDPSWSPDEQYIVFARSRTRKEYHEDLFNIRTRIEDAGIHELNQKYPVQFDLFRMPFNQGRGGTPEPLAGASENGMSNYFARYSPDGRWIVFTQSRSGIMLQPDSALYIIPADGGKARRMNCSREKFNSWHSFSPNGKWMLFSSKANSMFTEIFLTHIDENGMDSPPVCLSRFSDSRFAANVPEFVSPPAGAIRRIILTDN